MHDAQLELFPEEAVVYPKDTQVFDTPDLPPRETYSDLQWWVINHWAEWFARSLRTLGLY